MQTIRLDDMRTTPTRPIAEFVVIIVLSGTACGFVKTVPNLFRAFAIRRPHAPSNNLSARQYGAPR